MTRLINRPVDVTTGPGGVPVSFRLPGTRWKPVKEVLDHWLETGRWWERETEKATYRVLTADRGIFELTYDPTGRSWSLYKAYD